MISFILLVAALVCFLLATFGGYVGATPATPAGWQRFGFGWFGAALITISMLIATYPHP